MKKKRLLIAVGLSFVFTMVMYLSNYETTFAQECRIVRIIGLEMHRSVRIEPETLLVSKGDCVVWFNRAEAEDIKVSFADAKKCMSVTNAPVGFSADSAGCYVTNWIPFAGTSSLRFMEKGFYDYVLEVKGMPGVKIKGAIEVK
jgi:hypothetical protein